MNNSYLNQLFLTDSICLEKYNKYKKQSNRITESTLFYKLMKVNFDVQSNFTTFI